MIVLIDGKLFALLHIKIMRLKNNRIKAFLKLSFEAFGRYKKQIAVLTILGFLSGLLEGIGVNAIIPLFSFFIRDGDQGSDMISKFLKQSFGYFDIDFSLKQILIFVSLLFIFKAIAILIFNYISIKITANYEEQTRNRLFEKTLKASWPYLLKQKLGHLENTIKLDVDKSSSLLTQISNLIMVFTGLLVYIFIAINISFNITVITLALGGILFLLFKPLIRLTRSTARQVVEINKGVAHYINESVTGIKTIKAFFTGDKIIKIGAEFFKQYKETKIRIFLLKTVTTTMLQPISLVFICAVFAFSYKMPNFQFPALVAVVYLIQKIFQYIQQLQTGLHAINEEIPYLYNVLNYEKETDKNEEEDQRDKSFEFREKLEFKEVGFSYQPGKEILKDVNFFILKGEMVGLIGPSGSGKTTIVDLILQLIRPGRGGILLDKTNILDIELRDWRENVGYVSQDIFLRNDTIASNIKFYNDLITDEEMKAAAKMADIDDFIDNCPDKYLTVIGERGVMLSAGQRQRIVIARVLSRKPKVLILDEATSSLDNESEVKIQKVIENLKGKITIFVIAHRLSTVINCDRLLVLENGRIVETGAPKSLLKDKDSYFYKVYNIRK